MAAVVETCERGASELVTTHYFKTSYEKSKAAYLEILNELGYDVISIDDNYCEVFAEVPHMTVLAKFTEQNPRETAVDFYINAEYLLFSKKKALTFIEIAYTELESRFELKGTGLRK